MVAEQNPRTLSLEDAVEAVYEAAVNGSSVADEAAVVAHMVDDRDIYEAVVIGLGELVHRRLARRRRGGMREDEAGDGAVGSLESEDSDGPSPASSNGVPKAQPHAAKVLWDAILDDANYEAADSTRKALRQFGIEDSRRLRGIAGAMAAGHIRVRDAMDIAVGALERTGVKTIGALPLAERRRVVEALS